MCTTYSILGDYILYQQQPAGLKTPVNKEKLTQNFVDSVKTLVKLYAQVISCGCVGGVCILFSYLYLYRCMYTVCINCL